jgi:hypothetical protein
MGNPSSAQVGHPGLISPNAIVPVTSWIFERGAFRVLEMREDAYVLVAASATFPEVDLARLAYFAEQSDQHAALRAYRDELRAAPKRA